MCLAVYGKNINVMIGFMEPLIAIFINFYGTYILDRDQIAFIMIIILMRQNNDSFA